MAGPGMRTVSRSRMDAPFPACHHCCLVPYIELPVRLRLPRGAGGWIPVVFPIAGFGDMWHKGSGGSSGSYGDFACFTWSKQMSAPRAPCSATETVKAVLVAGRAPLRFNTRIDCTRVALFCNGRSHVHFCICPRPCPRTSGRMVPMCPDVSQVRAMPRRGR